jgi:hypothetical protein
MVRCQLLVLASIVVALLAVYAAADSKPAPGTPVPDGNFAVVCTNNQDCNDKNSCTTDVCIAGLCQHLFAGGQFCCQQAADCPEAKCRLRGCNPSTLRCAYSYDNKQCGPPPQSSGSPDDGDLVGAIIGIIILGSLVVIFVLVILMLIVRGIISKIRE